MKSIKINEIQADIIFKALHYTAKHEGIEIKGELGKVFKYLAERNPNETHAEDTLDVMEHLKGIITDSEVYKEWEEENY